MLVCRIVSTGLVLALCVALPLGARDTKDNPAAKPLKSDDPRHKQILKVVEKGEGDVIFLGDDLTQFWDREGTKVWPEAFGAFKPVNLGARSDQTGHVLWRLTEGKEIEPLKPKLAVIMIGMLNVDAGHTPEQIAGGVKAIIDELQKQKPGTKVLLLGLFPRDVSPDGKKRVKVNETNKILAKFADDKKVFYKDIGEKFLQKDGTLDKALLNAYPALTEKGYKIWADAIKEDIAKLIK